MPWVSRSCFFLQYTPTKVILTHSWYALYLCCPLSLWQSVYRSLVSIHSSTSLCIVIFYISGFYLLNFNDIFLIFSLVNLYLNKHSESIRLSGKLFSIEMVFNVIVSSISNIYQEVSMACLSVCQDSKRHGRLFVTQTLHLYSWLFVTHGSFYGMLE